MIEDVRTAFFRPPSVTPLPLLRSPLAELRSTSTLDALQRTCTPCLCAGLLTPSPTREVDSSETIASSLSAVQSCTADRQEPIVSERRKTRANRHSRDDRVFAISGTRKGLPIRGNTSSPKSLFSERKVDPYPVGKLKWIGERCSEACDLSLCSPSLRIQT